MTLPASGAISLNQVNVELGLSGTASINMGSAAVRGLFGVASGQISMSNGYGKSNTFTLTISSSAQEVNLSSAATAAGWNGSSSLIVNINSGVYLWSNNVANAGFLVNVAGAAINNSEYIIGKGGVGGNGVGTDGGAGGPAMIISSGTTSVTVTNNSGAYIAGGGGGGAGGTTYASAGGGGGGGAGGGNGGLAENQSYTPGQGGAIGSAGTTNTAVYLYRQGKGGGAGAGGGSTSNGGGTPDVGTGGGGGRILPGVGGGQSGVGYSGEIGQAGGSGGSAGSSGSYFSAGGHGGGGWAAAGGGGHHLAGTGGGAIVPNGNAYTLSNSGTIYGST